MRKETITGALISMMVLAALLTALHYYAATLEVQLAVPEILSVAQDGGNVTITWSEVEYATSYQVFSRRPGGEWNLEGVVSASTLTYSREIPGDTSAAAQYAVRACNKAGERVTLSAYSAPSREIGG